mmetsp:Transcript_37431/g.94036  ORF Transcript_37431/g.94036 Transcript_37431/m.94036 type:complete len:85 (+) Transcript_37431:1843-2097(+)
MNLTMSAMVLRPSSKRSVTAVCPFQSSLSYEKDMLERVLQRKMKDDSSKGNATRGLEMSSRYLEGGRIEETGENKKELASRVRV